MLITEAGPIAFQKLPALATSDVRYFQQWPIAADHESNKTLHQPQNYSTAYTAATAAPAASFSPATRNLTTSRRKSVKGPSSRRFGSRLVCDFQIQQMTTYIMLEAENESRLQKLRKARGWLVVTLVPLL